LTRSRYTLAFRGRLELDLVGGDVPPADSQALVVPQDVYLILGEVGLVEEAREPLAVVWAALGRLKPKPRGSVLVGPGSAGAPLVLQAIVYDFEDAPPARSVHVFEALLTAFEEARRRKLRSLALHPLGTAHQGVAPEEFVSLLSQVCLSAAELGTSLKHVHLLLPSPEELARYEALLASLAGRLGPVSGLGS
jgi:hypothetical protein